MHPSVHLLLAGSASLCVLASFSACFPHVAGGWSEGVGHDPDRPGQATLQAWLPIRNTGFCLHIQGRACSLGQGSALCDLPGLGPEPAPMLRVRGVSTEPCGLGEGSPVGSRGTCGGPAPPLAPWLAHILPSLTLTTPGDLPSTVQLSEGQWKHVSPTRARPRSLSGDRSPLHVHFPESW